MVTLRDLFIVELSDLLDAEAQVLRELPLMAARATSPALRDLFDEHYRQTQRHVDRLTDLFARLEERPRAVVCHGVRGLVEEARERHARWDRGEVLDAALVGAAQRLEHYQIAGYGCARSYAAALHDSDAVRVLQQTLDEERDADRRLTTIAESDVNARAATPRPRLAWSADTDVDEPRSIWSSSDLAPENELVVARGEPEWRAEEFIREQHASGGAMKERERNEDARGGDVIVNDSIASGRPDLPIDRDPGRETNVAIDADELGRSRAEETKPVERRD